MFVTIFQGLFPSLPATCLWARALGFGMRSLGFRPLLVIGWMVELDCVVLMAFALLLFILSK
jgi:hypothetical protein